MSALPSRALTLSGERLTATYLLTGDAATAREKAEDLCLEQTVEFPADLLPPGDIPDQVVGRLLDLQPAGAGAHRARIDFAVETTGGELTQLLNVLFGNISLKPGVRLVGLDLPLGLLGRFRGPRLGAAGWRERLGVPRRPLLCTAVKPMGLPAADLADLVYQFALGGIDLIKDDHGLADQPFAPFRERVARCAEAVARANRETGEACIYLPNLTGPADRLHDNARFAKDAGAGGLLFSPGLGGLDVMRALADDDGLDLPIMSHPAFQGSLVVEPTAGIAHGVIFGQLARLAGADATIFPNWGGRFSFTREECVEIIAGCITTMGEIKPILPAPGGGMTLSRVPEMLETYGQEVIFLIGGGLHRAGPDLVAGCRYFRRLVESMGG